MTWHSPTPCPEYYGAILLLLACLPLFCGHSLGQGKRSLILGNSPSTSERKGNDSSAGADLKWVMFCLDSNKLADDAHRLAAGDLLTGSQFLDCGTNVNIHPLIAVGVRIGEITIGDLSLLPNTIEGSADITLGELDTSRWADQVLAFPIQFIVYLDKCGHSVVKASHCKLYKEIFPGVGVFDCSILHKSFDGDSLGECSGTFVFYDRRQLMNRSVRSDLRFYRLDPLEKVIEQNLMVGRRTSLKTFKSNTCNDESPFEEGYFSSGGTVDKFARRRQITSEAVSSGNNSFGCDDDNGSGAKAVTAQQQDKWKYITLTF